MLRLLRADNFKCLDGFELRLDGHALLMGLNGSGKSTVVELLARLREFWVAGDKATDCFPGSTRTRWGSQRPQAFELQLETAGRPLRLRVEFGAADQGQSVRIVEEDIQGHDISVRRRGEAFIESGRGPIVQQQFLVPDELSALPLIFGQLVQQLPGVAFAMDDAASFVPFRIDPTTMATMAQAPNAALRFDGHNFSSWLLARQRYSPSTYQAIARRAADVLKGFVGFEFLPEGHQFRLITHWRSTAHASGGLNGATRSYDLDELSDGQRLILVLSALVEIAGQRELALILDEPDNYVALQEIQPLLLSLMDIPTVQLIVVSHHPEVIDLMAKDYGYVLAREDDQGPVRVKRWQAPPGTMLPASELVARGDIDGGA
ncbi:MAG TPA: AAA family ATPase [Kofleriaceae bacterium]